MTTVGTQAGTHEAVAGPTRGPGRPTKFTDTVCTRLLGYIREGHHIEPACKMAGVSYQTFREWMVAGDAGDPKYSEFSEQVHLAEAEAEFTLVNGIREAGERDWHARGWILARRFPDRWAEQSKRTVQHTGEITVKHEHLLTGLDLDAVRGLLQPPADPSIIDGEAHEIPPE